MYKVFIDTNIFLHLYNSKYDSLKVFEENLPLLKGHLLLTDQVLEEFLRNRDSILQIQINAISNIPKPVGETSLIRHLDLFTRVEDINSSVKDLKKDLLNRLQTIKDNTENDPVYKLVMELYNDSTSIICQKNDTIIQNANTRTILGNPPITKDKKTHCDQVIWETLLSHSKHDLIILTRDSDYLEKPSFLKMEYKSKVNKELKIVDKLTTVLEIIGQKPTPDLRNLEEEEEKEEKSPIVSGRWKVIKTEGNLATVTDGTTFGEMPINNPHISYLCPYCGSYGPWNGIICLTCGHRSTPEY